MMRKMKYAATRPPWYTVMLSVTASKDGCLGSARLFHALDGVHATVVAERLWTIDRSAIHGYEWVIEVVAMLAKELQEDNRRQGLVPPGAVRREWTKASAEGTGVPSGEGTTGEACPESIPQTGDSLLAGTPLPSERPPPRQAAARAKRARSL
jgi:hypothetical protein